MKKLLVKILSIVAVLVYTPFYVFASGDVMTTFSDAQFISGVNWGNITTTDSSITISNAHIIPDSSGGPVGFTVEWGTGSSGQNSSSYSPINMTQPYVLQGYGIDNYVFNITISNLKPVTDYYLTIREINPYEIQPGVTDYGYNLFTFGFATTKRAENPDIDLNYTNNFTNLNVTGKIFLSNGQVLAGEDIILQMYEVPPGTTLDENYTPTNLITSPIITTALPGSSNGSGYFEYNFGSVVPGSAHYLLIKRGIDQPNLILPMYFEVPTNSAPPTSTPPGNNPTTPSTQNGLIPCNGPDCDFNMLVVLINNVVDFLIVFIAFPFVAIVAAWAGILLLTSGGNPSAKEKAKGMIGNVIIGLVLALLSWGIIKIILVTLGYTGPLLSIFGIN
jgi:hypothetical protein